MNDKTKRALNSWLGLSDPERRDFQAAVEEYAKAAETKKRLIRESNRDYVMKVETGPLGSICPYCGR